MLGLSDAKAVGREELFSDSEYSQSENDDPTSKRILDDAMKQIYSAPTSTIASKTGIDSTENDPTEPADDPSGGEAFEFRLFASSEPTKLVVNDDEGDVGDGSIIGGGREVDYYLWSKQKNTRKRREEYKNIAVDGDTVKLWSERKCAGWTMPWRAFTISSSGKAFQTGTVLSDNHRKKRLGKKKRLVLRKRADGVRHQEMRDAEVKKSKEEAEREKRTRRNREKKVKRKTRERAKKT